MAHIPFLIELSENDKRLLIALLLLVFLVLVLIGWITHKIKKRMRIQGKKVDDYMYDMVKAKVIKDSKHFKKVAFKKSNMLLYHQARIPILILAIAWIIIGIFCIFDRPSNLKFLFSLEEGFSTLFFHFDGANTPKNTFFGLNLPCDWPPIKEILVNGQVIKCVPHALWTNPRWWISILTVPCLLVGTIWYLICAQAHLSRMYRIFVSSRTVFQKNLDEFATDPDIKNEKKE